jgi:hypothetical protein
MVEVEDIDDPSDESGFSRNNPRDFPDLNQPAMPPTPAGKTGLRKRKAGKPRKNNDPTSPPLSPRAAQNGATPLTKAQLTRWDGAYLAVLLALVWLFVLELIIVSKAARTVLVEKPVAFVAGCTKWCLQPVFATWSFLMSFRSLEKTA